MAWGRSFLLGGALLAALALAGPTAGADDVAGRVPKAPRARIAYYDWSGLYLGINAGYGFAKSQTDDLFSDADTGNPLFATGASSRLEGLIVGGQTGYNWQSGIWLVGIEADIAATNQRATKTLSCPSTSCNPALAGFDAPVSLWRVQKLDWFSTLRGRLGVTVTPDALVYATGGAAVDVGATVVVSRSVVRSCAERKFV